MSDLTQEIERGVGEFASGDNDPNDPNNNNNNSQQQGGDELQRQDNNYNDNNTTSEMRNDTRASTQQTETGGNNTGAGAMESTADNYINQGVDRVASDEGIPGVADGMINREVDGEVDKFL